MSEGGKGRKVAGPSDARDRVGAFAGVSGRTVEKAAAETRKELAILFKQADQEKPLSNRKIAKALNAGPATIDRVFASNAAPAGKTQTKTRARKARLPQMRRRRFPTASEPANS